VERRKSKKKEGQQSPRTTQLDMLNCNSSHGQSEDTVKRINEQLNVPDYSLTNGFSSESVLSSDKERRLIAEACGMGGSSR